MRNIFKISFRIGLFVCLFCACTDKGFLDETVTNDDTREVVFADSIKTARFLIQLYVDIGFDTDPARFSDLAGMHGGLQTACDEAEFKVSSSATTDVAFATGTINPVTVSSDVWDKCYRNIRRANLFLRYVDGCPMAESAKTTYKAETRFLRAWYYHILLRHYGGVPLIGDEVYEPEDAMKTERDTWEDCVSYIVQECEAAGRALPTRISGKNEGRITDSACKALISRVLLYAASPLYNGSDFAPAGFPKELLGYPEYNQERWKAAVDAARAVITTNQWKLFERHINNDGNPALGWGFYGVFKPDDFNGSQYQEYNGERYPGGAYCELILERKMDAGTDKNHLERCFYPPTMSSNAPSGMAYHELAEAFPMADGKPVGQSNRYSYDPLNPSNGRDPRFANTIIYDGLIAASNPWLGGDLYVYTHKGDGATSDAIYQGTSTGYYIRKLTHQQCNAFLPNPPETRPLIRYAEILLNYAEAVNEYYGPDYQEMLGNVEMSPYTVLKALRRRAGIEAGNDGMYGLKPNMSYQEMQDAIRLERRLELAIEGFRFFDVRRWMIAGDTDSKAMHGYEITKSLSGVRTGRVITVRTHVFRKAMYFWPIPYNEVSKSKVLLQNPYYEQ